MQTSFAPAFTAAPPMQTAALRQALSPPEQSLSNIVTRWRTMTLAGTTVGDLDVNALVHLDPRTVLHAVGGAAASAHGRFDIPGLCMLANAYIDVLGHAQVIAANNRSNALVQLTALDALATSLRGALRQAIATFIPTGIPAASNVALRTLGLAVDVPSTLSHWMYAAGDASLLLTSFTDHGQRFRVRLAGASLLIPVVRRLVSPDRDIDFRQLAALLHDDPEEQDAANIARWLCAHAESMLNARSGNAAEALRLAFRLCPTFDPDSLRASSTQSLAFANFLSEAWNHCRAALVELAEQQAPDGSWEDDAPRRAKFWVAAAELCERPALAWHTLLAEMVKRVPMYMNALPEQERPLLADLLDKLPVVAATDAQVAGLVHWYAQNDSDSDEQSHLVAPVKRFLERVVADSASARREPLYGFVHGYATNPPQVKPLQALLDLFSSYDRFADMESATAAQVLMNVDATYLRARTDTFENLLQVVARGEAPYADLCDKRYLPRWRMLASIEPLQPVCVSILQREYAEMRPAPSVAHVLQQAVAVGINATVTQKLEEIAAELPADGSLYIRLNMALAQRSRVAATSSFAAKGIQFPGAAKQRKQQPQSVERTLARLQSVLSRSAHPMGLQMDTVEPQPLDFLRQEMTALKDMDLSAVKSASDAVSLQAVRSFGEALSVNLDETFHELMTLAEVMVRRQDFRDARPIMENLLEYLGRADAKIDTKQRGIAESRLRAWAAEAPGALQNVTRAFSALDFAQSLRALHTDSPGKAQASRDRQQGRLVALQKIAQALEHNSSPEENLVRYRQIAQVMPQILSAMTSRSEREALSDFWPEALSTLGLQAFGAEGLILAYANVATSGDATRPRVKRLLDEIANVLTKGLAAEDSFEHVTVALAALTHWVEEASWTRALKVLLLSPQLLCESLPAAAVVRILEDAPTKVLRDHKAAMPYLVERLLESSIEVGSRQSSASESGSWCDDERLGFLHDALDALTFFRLLERSGVDSNNPVFRRALHAEASNRQGHVLQALTAASSEHVLSRQSKLYWSVREALVASTQDPDALLHQLDEALDMPAEERIEAQALAFLRTVLRQPALGRKYMLDADTRAILKRNLGDWHAALRTTSLASRVPETLALATLWRNGGDYTHAEGLVRELLAQGQHAGLAVLFDSADATLVDIAATVFHDHVRALSRETDQPATNADIDTALHIASIALRESDKLITGEVERAKGAFLNAVADAIADTPLLDRIAPSHRAVLTDVISTIGEHTLTESKSVALTQRLARTWVNTSRNAEVGRQLASQMERIVSRAVNHGPPATTAQNRQVVLDALEDCLRDTQEAKAWRLMSLLPDADGLCDQTRHTLLLASHLCAPQERINISKVLAATSPTDDIPDLLDDGNRDKGPWSILMKIPMAASWLALHIQHVSGTVGELPDGLVAKWNAAVSRLPKSDRDEVQAKTVASVPVTSPLYQAVCLARVGQLEGTALLKHILDMVPNLRGSDETLSVVRDGFARINASGLDTNVQLDESERKALLHVTETLRAVPTASRLLETEVLALISSNRGDWGKLASHVIDLLIARAAVPHASDRSENGVRCRALQWAQDVLVNVRRHEAYYPDKVSAFRSFTSRFVLSIPPAAFDAPLIAEVFATLAHCAAKDPDLSHLDNAVGVLRHLDEASQVVVSRDARLRRWGASQFEAANVTRAPYGLLPEPRNVLQSTDAYRVELLAPALCIDLLRMFSAPDQTGVDYAPVKQAFTFAMHHAQGAQVLSKTMDVVARLFGKKTEFPRDIVPSAINLMDARNSNASLDEHVEKQAMIFADLMASLFTKSRCKCGERLLPTIVGSVPSAMQGSVIDIAVRQLESTTASDGLLYLANRVDMLPEMSRQQETRLRAALVTAAGRTRKERDAVFEVPYDVALHFASHMEQSSCSAHITRHFTTLAPMIFDALAQTGRPSVQEVRDWFSFVLLGRFFEGKGERGHSANPMWEAITSKLKGLFSWEENQSDEEMLDSILRNAHTAENFHQLQHAQSHLVQVELIPRQMTRAQYARARPRESEYLLYTLTPLRAQA